MTISWGSLNSFLASTLASALRARNKRTGHDEKSYEGGEVAMDGHHLLLTVKKGVKVRGWKRPCEHGSRSQRFRRKAPPTNHYFACITSREQLGRPTRLLGMVRHSPCKRSEALAEPTDYLPVRSRCAQPGQQQGRR
jgi:hypothetical protein